MLRATNSHTRQVLATDVRLAATHVSRAVGLLGRTGLEEGEALWIVPSRGVHTFAMRFSIDVVALDRDCRVVDVVSMRPWRVRLPRRGVVSVLELPSGVLERSQTEVGHAVTFEMVSR